MRKGIAIALLIVLLFFTAGYHLLFYLRIAEARAGMKQAILQGRTENLTQFQFSIADFESLVQKDGDEFEYAGKLYDVVKTERNATGIAVWCLSDVKEKEAVDAYLEAQKQNSKNNPSAGLAKLLSVPFIGVGSLRLVSPGLFRVKPQTFYLAGLPTCSLLLLFPPPKRC